MFRNCRLYCVDAQPLADALEIIHGIVFDDDFSTILAPALLDGDSGLQRLCELSLQITDQRPLGFDLRGARGG